MTNTLTFTQTTKKFGKCLQEVFSLVFEFSISLPLEYFLNIKSLWKLSLCLSEAFILAPLLLMWPQNTANPVEKAGYVF